MKKKLLTIFTIFALFNAKAQTGDLYDMSFVHDVRIILSAQNPNDALDSMRLAGDGMLLGTVTIDGTVYENVGISYAKSPTYQMSGKRNPMLIRLNLVKKTQNHQGYKLIMLSSALRDPSLVREVLSYEIARKYILAPKANFVNLTVNGDNRGIYANVEPVSDEFLTKNFGNTEGVLFRCAPDTKSESANDCRKTYGALTLEKNPACYIRHFEMLSREGWDDLIELSRVIAEEPNKISESLNIDRTLWYLAFNNLTVNLSSYIGQYSNNYYLYRDASKRFNIIPAEMNLAFGSYKNANGASDLDFNGLVELDPLLHADNALKPLVSALLKNPEYKKIYFAHYRQILVDWFDNGNFEKRALALQTMIAPYVENAPEKPYSVAEFKRSLTSTVGNTTKIPGISELMTPRTKWLKKQPDLAVVPPSVSSVDFSRRKRLTTQGITDFKIKVKVDNFPRGVRCAWRPADSKEPFQILTLLDNGKSHDEAAGDKIFGGIIQPNGKFTAIEYYIIAENAAAISFEPSNYMTERRKMTLGELNQ